MTISWIRARWNLRRGKVSSRVHVLPESVGLSDVTPRMNYTLGMRAPNCGIADYRDRPGTGFREANLYQSSLSPNCICLAVVDVLVISPAVGETPLGVNTTAFGVLKFGWLRKLNNSARN